MIGRWLSLVFAAMLVPVSLASAQTGSGTQGKPVEDASAAEEENGSRDDTIVVTGKAAKANQRKEIASFARQIIRRPARGEPVARLFLPVCATTLGIPEEFAVPLLKRVRENARVAGLRVNEKPSCKPNLYVIFADQTEKFYSERFWMRGPTLAHLISPERSRVLADNGPVKAWNSSLPRSASGMRMVAGSNHDLPVGGAALTNQQYSLSRLRTATTSEIVRAYVAFDVDAVQGMSVRKLADYATMRTLAPTSAVQDASGGPADTILTLFDSPSPPREITQFDRVLLKSLYSASLTVKPQILFGRIGSAAINLEAAE